MKTPKQDQFDAFLIDESDEYLLKMTEELKEDLCDLKVSEDLIARTLARISEQAKDEDKKEESNVVAIRDIKAPVKNRRAYQWIKPLSVVAAACFLLFLGANIAKNGLFIGNKKSMSESSAYDMNATSIAGDGRVEMKNDVVLKSAEVVEDRVQSQITSENQQAGDSLVAPQTTEQAKTDKDNGKGSDNNMLYYTALENTAYNRALEAARSSANDEAKIYEFAQSSDDMKTTSLLSLLTSEELGVTTEEANDEWEYYLVFSLGEEDAVTYQIGRSKFVLATNYHGDEEAIQIIYQMKNVDNFLESLTGFLE